MESHSCGRQLRAKSDAYAVVFAFVADRDAVGVGGLEPESITLIIGQLIVCDSGDHGLDGLDVVGRLESSEVDIRCRSAKFVCGQ